MSLLELYPKTHRDYAKRLAEVFRLVPALGPRECEDLALAINTLADKACDLEDIFQALVREQLSASDLADLLAALELTLEQIRGHSEAIDGKLYECADRLKENHRYGNE